MVMYFKSRKNVKIYFSNGLIVYRLWLLFSKVFLITFHFISLLILHYI